MPEMDSIIRDGGVSNADIVAAVDISRGGIGAVIENIFSEEPTQPVTTFEEMADGRKRKVTTASNAAQLTSMFGGLPEISEELQALHVEAGLGLDLV